MTADITDSARHTCLLEQSRDPVPECGRGRLARSGTSHGLPEGRLELQVWIAAFAHAEVLLDLVGG